MRSIHIKRSELYASKGQVTLSPATGETRTPTNDELNETLAEIITKKYIPFKCITRKTRVIISSTVRKIALYISV